MGFSGKAGARGTCGELGGGGAGVTRGELGARGLTRPSHGLGLVAPVV